VNAGAWVATKQVAFNAQLWQAGKSAQPDQIQGGPQHFLFCVDNFRNEALSASSPMTTAEISQRRLELPFVSFIILPDLFLSLLITLRPRVTLRLIAFAVFVYVKVRGLSFTTGDAFHDYGIGSMFSCTIIHYQLRPHRADNFYVSQARL
jgi:hypothetical protein